MHAADRDLEDYPRPLSTHHPYPVIGRWLLVAVCDPELDRCVHHADEPLRPSGDEPTRAEFVVRRNRSPQEIGIYVKGVVLHGTHLPVVLATWHRAIRRSDGP